MNGSNAVGRIFKDTYQKLSQSPETVFDRDKDRTVAIEDIKLPPGHMSCFESGGFHYILIGTRFGTVVLWDSGLAQGSNEQYGKFVPGSKLLKAMLPNRSPFVGTAEMASVVGPWGKMDRNIGFLVEEIIEELKEELGK